MSSLRRPHADSAAGGQPPQTGRVLPLSLVSFHLGGAESARAVVSSKADQEYGPAGLTTCTDLSQPGSSADRLRSTAAISPLGDRRQTVPGTALNERLEHPTRPSQIVLIQSNEFSGSEFISELEGLALVTGSVRSH
jgi:hypothetical protein